jgi:ribosome-associated protein
MGTSKVFEGEALALAAAGYADEKQAEDIVILDLRGISSIADFFVICTGTSTPHLKAVRREVADKLHEEHDLRPRATDGNPESQWLILDYIDVLVHVFHEESRAKYSLEDLWSDAERIAFEPAVAG